ncbi:hypothetical protein EPM78_09205 [Neisseria gonorrhoeae]|nr:hypothetical protein A6J44_05940 [Neisseria gonorrhoeae]KMY24562.1 hypothetical protein NGDG_00398 [Neisseria gonorrhoeae FA6140]AZG17560.1 hypothetical protein EGH15_01230 [Neisseria gonorrhoeae]AZG22160.1 hypothetical protein EGH14_01245 [Neisseria gonorrhoeae]AZG24465.1 hypothetical protein EGH18_01230 [Neisseria gonorrhoeae]
MGPSFGKAGSGLVRDGRKPCRTGAGILPMCRPVRETNPLFEYGNIASHPLPPLSGGRIYP